MFWNQSAVPLIRRLGVICACLALLQASGSPARAGIKIVPTYDQSINSLWNAKQVKDVVSAVIKFYDSKLTDDVTININFVGMNTGLGQSSKPVYVLSYYNYLAALTKDSATPNDKTALANLPVQYLDPILGNSQMFIFQANLKALGFKTGNGADGTIGLNTSRMFADTASIRRDKFDMYAVIAHEINEVLGLGSAVGFNAILPEDLYRYDISGQRSFTTNISAVSFFSIDGVVRRARFNQLDSGDYGDWYSGEAVVTPQVNDAFATPGVIVDRKMNNELLALDVIGFNVGAQPKIKVSGLTGARYYGVRVGNQNAGVPPTEAAPNPERTVPRRSATGGTRPLGKGLFFPGK